MIVLPSNVVVPDLQPAARSEADRARNARRLGEHDASRSLSYRPVITRIRRRSAPERCYWAFRLAYEYGEGSWHSDVLVGMCEPVARLMSATAASIRERLAQHTADVLAAARREQREMLAGIHDRARVSVELATRRELAILDSVREQHARVAARLLQPSLFDRRTERAAAAQSSLLHAVLTDGTAHLRALERSGTLTVGACDLVFAILIG